MFFEIQLIINASDGLKKLIDNGFVKYRIVIHFFQLTQPPDEPLSPSLTYVTAKCPESWRNFGHPYKRKLDMKNLLIQSINHPKEDVCLQSQMQNDFSVQIISEIMLQQR